MSIISCKTDFTPKYFQKNNNDLSSQVAIKIKSYLICQMSSVDNNKQEIEKKIGEALGLEMAAQKAVEELGSKELLDKGGMKDKLEKMRKQANNHQTDLELILLPSLGLDSINIQKVANETWLPLHI